MRKPKAKAMSKDATAILPLYALLLLSLIVLAV